MLDKFGQAARNARYRSRAYRALVSWLLRIAFRHFRAPLALSSFASGTAVAFQGLALAVMVGAVSQFQNLGHLESFPGLDRLGIVVKNPTIETIVTSFVVLFLLASGLAYLSRSVAIRLESRVYRHFYNNIIARLALSAQTNDDLIALLERQHEIRNAHEIPRVLMADARFAGVILRLALFNVIHLGNIVVGLLIIGFYAPALLPLIVGFAATAGICMYPLNLRATRVTRDLEKTAPLRNAYIKKRLADVLDPDESEVIDSVMDDEAFVPTSDGSTTVDPAALDERIVDRHLHLIESRLRILESSRIVMSTLVACGIGSLVWLLFRGDAQPAVSYSAIIVLFFGLRFVMNGIEGAMITVTSINRFLPNLIRLEQLVSQLDAIEQLENERREREEADNAWLQFGDHADDSAAGYPWQTNSSGLRRMRGSFLRGSIYGIAGRSIDPMVARAELRDIVISRRKEVDAAQLVQAEPPMEAVTERERQWVKRTLARGNVLIPDSVVDGCLDGKSAPSDEPRDIDLINFLANCRQSSTAAATVVLLDGEQLFKMDPPGVRAVCTLFGDRVTFIVSRNITRALNNLPTRQLMLSDGERIVCACTIENSRRPMMDKLIDKITRGKVHQVRQVVAEEDIARDVVKA